MVAGVIGLIGLGVVVAGLVELVATRSTDGADWVGLRIALGVEAVAVAWAVCVRPCVVVDSEGVTIRNILRDVRIPWAALTGVEVRWDLVVQTARASYPAWAIAGSPGPSRRRAGRVLVATGVGAPGDRARPADVVETVPPAEPTDSRAATVAAVIEAGLLSHAAEAGRRDAEVPMPWDQPARPGSGEQETVRFVPAALVALLAPLLTAVAFAVA